jgi:hypothetical protein
MVENGGEKEHGGHMDILDSRSDMLLGWGGTAPVESRS